MINFWRDGNKLQYLYLPKGKVSVYEYSEAARRWTRVETFSNMQDPVHDIAFAPNIGTPSQ